MDQATLNVKNVEKTESDEVKNESQVPQDIFGVEGFCDRYDAIPSWVYKMVRERRIPHYKIGKYIKFKAAETDAWFENQKRV